jgi:hypothetical protein
MQFKVKSIGVVIMWPGELQAYGLALLGVGLAGHRGTEEKDAENTEQNDEFEDDQPDERTAPSLVLEAFPIEIPYFMEQPCHPIPFCKYKNSFSDFFIILPTLHKTLSSP